MGWKNIFAKYIHKLQISIPSHIIQMASELRLYMTSVSSNKELKDQQNRMTMILDSKKIPYVAHDIASDPGAKVAMRAIAGDKSFPPQISRDEELLGDYCAFNEAVEDGQLMEFLKL